MYRVAGAMAPCVSMAPPLARCKGPCLSSSPSMLPLLSLSNCAKSIFATAFPPDIGAAGVRVRYAYEGEFDGEDDDDDHERGRRPRVSTTTSTTTKSMECPTTTTSAPGQATAMMCHVFFVIPTDVYKKPSSQKAFVSSRFSVSPPRFVLHLDLGEPPQRSAYSGSHEL